MITFDVAYTWLNQFADRDSQLSASALPLKRHIEEVLAAREYARIPELVDRLNRIARVSPNRGEAGEIFVICARAYYRMGAPADALPWLDLAMAKYIADAHNRAVVQWLKGCIEWEIPGNEAEAAPLWQRSLNVFSGLANQRAVSQPGAIWYQERCAKMGNAIGMAALVNEANPRLVQELYGIFEVLAPAYTDLTEPVTRVKTNVFGIGDRQYQLVNLSDQATIALPDASGLIALKVTEDAMNLAGIEIDDHVLLRWQNIPAPNDIVAVLFDGEDSIKLRSYTVEGANLIFHALSRSTTYPPRSFANLNVGHQVRGVVLGVFKPV